MVLALGTVTAAVAQTTTSITVPGDDPRPISTVLRDLQEKYGLSVTYEDPRYQYSGDLQDVSERVRRGNSGARGEPVLVPRGKPFKFVYSLSDVGSPEESRNTVARMLSEYARIGGPVFSVILQIRRGCRLFQSKSLTKTGNWRSRLQFSIRLCRFLQPSGQEPSCWKKSVIA